MRKQIKWRRHEHQIGRCAHGVLIISAWRKFPPDAPVAGSLIYVRDGWIRCQWLDIAYVTRELDATR